MPKAFAGAASSGTAKKCALQHPLQPLKRLRPMLKSLLRPMQAMFARRDQLINSRSAAQTHEHSLHVVIGVNGGQKGLDFFQLTGAQGGRGYGVLGFVPELGRQDGEALGR